MNRIIKPNAFRTCDLLVLSGLKIVWMFFFRIQLNAFTSITMLKTHCVTNLRASTQRWAGCVLELLSYKLSSSRNINGKPVKEDAFFLVKSPFFDSVNPVMFFVISWVTSKMSQLKKSPPVLEKPAGEQFQNPSSLMILEAYTTRSS